MDKADLKLIEENFDADWFRQAFATRGSTPCIPSKSNRKKPIEHDRVLYRQWNKIENMFGRLKDDGLLVDHRSMLSGCLPTCRGKHPTTGISPRKLNGVID